MSAADVDDLLRQVIGAPAWHADAACREHPSSWWWPEHADPSGARHLREARAVCAGCLVNEECRTFALETGQAFGVWAGLTPRQRQLLRRDRRNDRSGDPMEDTG